MQNVSPTLHKALGSTCPSLPLTAILGIAILNINLGYNLLEVVIHSLGASLGFTLALVMLAGIRKSLNSATFPKPLPGSPCLNYCRDFGHGLFRIRPLGGY